MVVVDRVTALISDYVTSVEASSIDERVAHEVKRRILDSIGCFLGATRSETWRIACRAAQRFDAHGYAATIWGVGRRSPPDWAAFANGVGVRYLDFNDTYLSREPLHPSDMIPAVLAVGEAEHSSGRDVITAIAVGYEVGMRLCDATSLRVRGWDHVNFTMVGAVGAISNLMKLDPWQTRNALAMAVVPHASMRQTRVGELSMWKGAAAANSCRNAVFACLLAREGYTGPDEPFEGEMGFIRQVSREMDYGPLEELRGRPPPRKMLESYMKFYPVEYHAQSAVQAALEIARELPGPEQVERVEVETFRVGYEIIVKDPEKWSPKTRETADHSLPYCVAAALVFGDMWLEAFEPHCLEDPRIRELMRRMDVRVSDAIDALYPAAVPNLVRVRLKDGRTIERRVDHPVGHAKNPPSDEQVISKFNRLAKSVVSESRASDIVRVVFSIEGMADIGELISLIATVG